MRCAIGQAPKRLYVSSIISAVAIAVFGGVDLRMAAIILLFLFFVLSCEMMACFSTPHKISMEMVAISMLAGGVLPMMLSTLLLVHSICRLLCLSSSNTGSEGLPQWQKIRSNQARCQ